MREGQRRLLAELDGHLGEELRYVLAVDVADFEAIATGEHRQLLTGRFLR